MSALAGIEEAVRDFDRIRLLLGGPDFLSPFPEEIPLVQDRLLDVESEATAIYKFAVMQIRGTEDIDEIRDAWQILHLTYSSWVAQMEGMKWQNLSDPARALFRRTLTRLEILRDRSQKLYELHA